MQPDAHECVLLVLANLPFALAGGALAALFSGASLSLGSLVGFIALFGISARNSILLISHYEELVLTEGMACGLDADYGRFGKREGDLINARSA